MSESTLPPRHLPRVHFWPWLVLAMTVLPAFWHVLDFPDDIDEDYPSVSRPTFSRWAPPAYRLAEPGDTLDRVAIYLSAATLALSLVGAWQSRNGGGLWWSALGLSLAAFWHASTPGPTFDGWHGLGWRVILDESAPLTLRIALAVAAGALAVLVVRPLVVRRSEWGAMLTSGRDAGALSLLGAALVLVACRQVEVPGLEPVGYWPRWAFIWGLLAFALALLFAMPRSPLQARLRRAVPFALGALGWLGLVATGIGMTWYHRPLERLKTVVPGKIYISAMPTERGLEVAQARHHFKTIINLFPEDSPLRSPLLPEELRFAETHGIRYIGSPPEEEQAGTFLDETLRVVQDPQSWPVLVHCHGCMDRSPAWMGIYRFLVEGKPLDEILTEIERHRGYRPKASVTLLYNRILSTRDPDRYAADPTARILMKCAEGTPNPTVRPRRFRPGRANPLRSPRVERATEPRADLPNLTPSRRSLEYPKTLRDPRAFDPAASS